MFIPNDSLPSPSTIVSGDIPGTVRSWYHGQMSMPGTLALCLPQIKIVSAGHKYMDPLQEIPFVIPRPILEEGTFLFYSLRMVIIFYTDTFSFTVFFFKLCQCISKSVFSLEELNGNELSDLQSSSEKTDV